MSVSDTALTTGGGALDFEVKRPSDVTVWELKLPVTMQYLAFSCRVSRCCEGGWEALRMRSENQTLQKDPLMKQSHDAVVTAINHSSVHLPPASPSLCLDSDAGRGPRHLY